jgi:hypothetical protein
LEQSDAWEEVIFEDEVEAPISYSQALAAA